MIESRADLSIPANLLDGRYDPAALPFQTTAELQPLDAVLGQQRAVRAIEFAFGMRSAGYHLYAAGPDGLGKTSIVEAFLKEKAAEMPAPVEWAFVRNFDDPDRPTVLSFAPGEARQFAKAVSTSVTDVIAELRQAFDSDSYTKQRQLLVQKADHDRSGLLTGIQTRAEQLGFGAEFTPQGIVTVALVEGQPMTTAQFEALPDEQKHAIEAANEELRGMVADVLLRMRTLERETNAQIRALAEELVASVVDEYIGPLRTWWDAAQVDVGQFLRELRADLIQHHEQFLTNEEAPAPWMPHSPAGGQLARLYQVNVLGGRDGVGGAPVVVEPNPTYHNLIGRIEYTGQFGMMVTDHTMIRPGSLLLANGGFLVLRARDLLSNPAAYDGLKRALKRRLVTIENLGEQFGLIPASGLRPQSVPLDVQVIIVGDRELQGALYRLDPDFRELFRVRADFDTEFERNDANVLGLASLIRAQSETAGLRSFTAAAVAELVRHCSRMADDQRELTANMGAVVDLLHQANFWAAQDKSTEADVMHVQRALDEQVYRSAFVRDRISQLMADGTIHVDTDGSAIGQVNGLSVIDVGDTNFGQPSRITCVTSSGQGRLVAIERETHLAGPIHDKGFLTVRGFLAQRFGQRRAMAMDGSLTFEQLYGSIEGDSASSSELFAILSSLSDLPVRQSIAVTGSVDQRGEIQAVGGVTAKIEGFFELCQLRGLDGSAGVVIPSSNVHNVVLRPVVADAIAAGQFHVWAIDSVEDGIEVLTGVPAGTRQTDGQYPEGTVFRRIEDQLETYAHDGAAHPVAATDTVIPQQSAETPLPPGVPAVPPPAPPTRLQPARPPSLFGAEPA